MKCTSNATMINGFVIAGFAKIQYSSTGPADHSAYPLAACMELPNAFGISFIILREANWIFCGRGYVLSVIGSGRRTTAGTENVLVKAKKSNCTVDAILSREPVK
jgi:hypothetical protein